MRMTMTMKIRMRMKMKIKNLKKIKWLKKMIKSPNWLDKISLKKF